MHLCVAFHCAAPHRGDSERQRSNCFVVLVNQRNTWPWSYGAYIDQVIVIYCLICCSISSNRPTHHDSIYSFNDNISNSALLQVIIMCPTEPVITRIIYDTHHHHPIEDSRNKCGRTNFNIEYIWTTKSRASHSNGQQERNDMEFNQQHSR